MIKQINLQFLISYLGSVPFIIIIFDKFFLYKLDSNIMKDFTIFYSLIIFVFIGALNWSLKKNISTKLILIGFFPSLISLFIILLFLYSHKVFLLLIIFFIAQLIIDNFIYKNNFERKIYFLVRISLTALIVLCLILIQL